MVDIRPVKCSERLQDPEVLALFKQYAAECSTPELGPINPHCELYDSMEKSGHLQAFAVYDSDKLIGFATVMIYILPHYSRKIAATESIFVSKAHNGAGAELIAFIEDYAKAMGCVAFMYSAPQGSRFSRLLSTDTHYRHTNSVYLRSLV